MLGDKNAIATIAVKDTNVAARFYEGILGLAPLPAVPGVLSYKSGNSTVLVYESQYARTNKATAATWAVGDDVEGVVKSLKAKGVTFERYDLPGTTQTDDVLVSGKIKAAWFKDPDGNILQLVNG
jgi:catechol 2,3-dioxygenase-like lactoylglutathione lyase family enzyme